MQEDDFIVVQGCGPIGLGIIMLARYLGAEVIALDVNPQRINYARNHFDVVASFNPLDKKDQQLLTDMLKTRKADVVIDATGNAKAIPGVVRYMRHGGKLVLVGIANTEISFHHPSIHAKETTIICSRNATPADFELVIEAMVAGALNMNDYVTRKVGSGEIADQIDYWISPDSPDIKIVTAWD